MPDPVAAPKDKRIKIAWLHSHFHNWMGGTIFVYQVIKRMRKDYDITVFVESSSEYAKQQFAELGVEVIETTGISSDGFRYWLFFKHYLKKSRSVLAGYMDDFDVIVTSMFPMNWLASRFNNPHVQYCYEPFAHFFDDEMINSMPFVQRLARKTLRRLYGNYDKEGVRTADRILTLSDKNAVWIKDVYGRGDAKVTFEGVDTEHFHQVADAELSRQYAGQRVIMHSTDFSPIKGTEYLIKAMPDVINSVPECRLLITSTMTGTGRQNVIKTINKLGIDDNISFLGFLASDDVPKYYSLADVVVQPSINQSMSLSVKEAMACETPVIRSLDTTEEVVDGESGFLVDPKDSAALAAAIIRLLEDSGLGRKMGRAGRARVIERFSWDSVAGKIEDEVRSAGLATRRAGYRVRELRDTDADLLFEFFSGLSDEAKTLFNPHPFSREFSGKLTRDIARKRWLRMVALADGSDKERIIGYGFISTPRIFSKYGYFGVAVADDFSRRGVATALMDELAKTAGRAGTREILLDVKRGNTGALALYRKHGFVEQPCSLAHRVLTLREAVYSFGLLFPIKQKISALMGHNADGDSSICMRKKIATKTEE